MLTCAFHEKMHLGFLQSCTLQRSDTPPDVSRVANNNDVLLVGNYITWYHLSMILSGCMCSMLPAASNSNALPCLAGAGHG